jgi:hypothetical protein
MESSIKSKVCTALAAHPHHEPTFWERLTECWSSDSTEPHSPQATPERLTVFSVLGRKCVFYHGKLLELPRVD